MEILNKCNQDTEAFPQIIGKGDKTQFFRYDPQDKAMLKQEVEVVQSKQKWTSLDQRSWQHILRMLKAFC